MVCEYDQGVTGDLDETKFISEIRNVDMMFGVVVSGIIIAPERSQNIFYQKTAEK